MAGGLAIAQLGASATSATTSAGSAAGVSFAPERTYEGEDTGPAYGANLTFYMMGADSARLGEQLERARWDMERSGLDPAMIPSGGYE